MTNTNPGPTLVTPEPYWTCEGCRFRQAETVGNGAFTYSKWICVQTWTTLENSLLTPDWCPLLPKGPTNATD